MPDPQEVIKRLQENDSDLTVQVGREGEIIGKPTGFVSTRCPTLDWLVGRPGLPLGGISLLIGAYGSGKSTIVLNVLAETQASGGQAIIVDTEGRLDFDRCQKLGVNVDELITVQPTSLEETFAGVKAIIQASREVLGEDDHIVLAIDSIAGAPLEKDVKGEKSALGAQSLLIRRELRVLSMLVNRQRIGLVITTQPRQKINLGQWGKPSTSWMGEDPLGHAAMTTLMLEQKAKLGDDPNSPIGHSVMATLIDTRIAGCVIPECKDCRRKGFRRTFDFYAATGPDFFSSALEVLMEAKAITHNGGWYKFGADKKGFRRGDFEEELTKRPELMDALRNILKGAHQDEPA